MTDNVENLILEHMRSLRAGQDNIAHELREVQVRISSLEAAVLGNKRELVFTFACRSNRKTFNPSFANPK